jgi:iron complex outermembrane receptor protein
VFNNGVTSYRFVVHDSKSYNVFATYRVSSTNRWLNNTSLRLGVNNVLDAQPPLSSDSRGYEVGLYNTMARGRTYSLQVTKKL